MNVIRRLRRRWSRPEHRGQSLVELAITLPVVLLIVVGTVDLGRAYFMTINMENAVKEGAFYGARNPQCDSDATAGCSDPKTVQWRVEQELDGVGTSSFTVKCFVPGTTGFTGAGKALADCEDGDLYYVALTAPFGLITPIMSNLIGGSITLSSDAIAVVLTDFASGGEVVIPTPAPTPTLPPGSCTVPDFRNGTKIGEAQGVWESAGGFTTTVTTVGGNGQQITWQSLPFGTVGPCSTTTIIVSNAPQATATPTPSPTPTPVATPTPTPTSSASATATPTATPTPAPTPAQCTVPQLVRSPRISVTQAQAVWTSAGFSASNFSAVRPPNDDYRVRSQSVAAGSARPCLTATIQVDD